eukprot:10757250-Ditylum_brightwellii.AAC.1
MPVAAAHVSASNLTCKYPDSLVKALLPPFQDRLVWHTTYMEELNRLIKLGVFERFPWMSIVKCKKKGAPAAIPTMCVSNLKHDEQGNPVCAKSCIVVLGHLK